MTERYDEAAAAHYAAYRPPLHESILGRVLAEEPRAEVGLDVGCGTGVSAVALAAFCARVIGVEPSPSMLERAMPHEQITYLPGSADALPLPDRSVDVVTLAGVLHYADSDATRSEIQRVGRAGARVVIYDFEVLLEPILQAHGVEPDASPSDYDHRANLSGTSGFIEQRVESETVELAMTPEQCAHVLLSDSNHFDSFARQYESADPFPQLVDALRVSGRDPTITANLFYASYTVE
ncbi:MAG: class I SAM-dependent methyltransferase [Bacteroidota bacterium]